MAENSSENLKIDVDRVVRDKLGPRARFIPRFVTLWLKRLICQDRLNELLRHNAKLTGSEFCRGVLADMNVTFAIHGEDNLPAPDDTRVLYVSNHPLGGLDGLVLIDMLSRHHRRDVRFVVNDLLGAIKPMRSLFIPVNKHGAQGKDTLRLINEGFASSDPIVMFPAGLCSRRSPSGEIRDLKWQKMFIIKAIQSGRTVITLYFSGHNSSYFYKFAHWREKSGIKFNIEMLLLPREMIRGEGQRFDIHVGAPITPARLSELSPADMAEKIQETVNRLKPAGES